LGFLRQPNQGLNGRCRFLISSSWHYTFINMITMPLLPTLSFSTALLAMLFAILYQRRDMRPGTGGTMGGEMTAGLIWVVASLLCALGSLAFVPWYFAIGVFVVAMALSFLVRMGVARIPKR
jgi:hypothetical protein